METCQLKVLIAPEEFNNIYIIGFSQNNNKVHHNTNNWLKQPSCVEKNCKIILFFVFKQYNIFTKNVIYLILIR